LPDAADGREQGVAAGYQQGEKREFRRIGLEHGREQMAF
jgi:hypothetical protein